MGERLNFFDTSKNKIYKRTLSLFFPIALQNLLTLLLGLTDNLFAARIAKDAISSIVVGGQMQLLLQFLVYGISGTALLAVSRMRSRGEGDEAVSVALLSAGLSMLLGVVFYIISALWPLSVSSFFTVRADIAESAAEYLRSLAPSFPIFALCGVITAVLRAAGRAKGAMLASFTALVVSIGLNYLAICVGAFGEPTVAYIGRAAVFARILELTVLVLTALPLLKSVRLKVGGVISRLRGALPRLWQYGKYIILGQIVWAANSLFATLVVGRRLPREAVAALGVASLMHNLSYVMINALSISVCSVLASLGEGEAELRESYVRRAELSHLLLGAVSGCLIFLFSGQFISFYNLSESARNVAHSFLRVLSVTVVGTAYQSGALYGILRAERKNRFVFFTDLSFVLLVLLPYSFIAAELGAAPYVVFAALKCDQILKCIPAAVKLRSKNRLWPFMSKKSRNRAYFRSI